MSSRWTTKAARTARMHRGQRISSLQWRPGAEITVGPFILTYRLVESHVPVEADPSPGAGSRAASDISRAVVRSAAGAVQGDPGVRPDDAGDRVSRDRRRQRQFRLGRSPAHLRRRQEEHPRHRHRGQQKSLLEVRPSLPQLANSRSRAHPLELDFDARQHLGLPRLRQPRDGAQSRQGPTRRAEVHFPGVWRADGVGDLHAASDDVFQSLDREAKRIGWDEMWIAGRVIAIRKTDDERYVIAYRASSESEANNNSPDRDRFIVARYLQICHRLSGVELPRRPPEVPPRASAVDGGRQLLRGRTKRSTGTSSRRAARC